MATSKKKTTEAPAPAPAPAPVSAEDKFQQALAAADALQPFNPRAANALREQAKREAAVTE